MNKKSVLTAVFGIAANFILFAVKLYIGISSNALSVYCDAINNLGDTFACIIALSGFVISIKLDERRGRRAESLAGFVIGIIVAVTGFYFAYNGAERLMYPTPVRYLTKYAVLLFITALVKIAMGIIYIIVYKKDNSPVLKALILDSFLDTGITLAALMGFFLITKLNYAVDGAFSVILGIVIAVGAVKTIITQAKALIND